MCEYRPFMGCQCRSATREGWEGHSLSPSSLSAGCKSATEVSVAAGARKNPHGSSCASRQPNFPAHYSHLYPVFLLRPTGGTMPPTAHREDNVSREPGQLELGGGHAVHSSIPH